jgi:hypothetical protein
LFTARKVGMVYFELKMDLMRAILTMIY